VSYQPRTVDLSTIEYFAAAFIFGWGFWILSWGPGEAVSAAAFDFFRNWILLMDIGPPWRVIGITGMIAGLLYAVAICINGRGMYWTPIVRGTSCILAVIFLVNLSASVFQIQPSSTAVYTYGSLSVIYFSIFMANLRRLAHSLELIWERFYGMVA